MSDSQQTTSSIKLATIYADEIKRQINRTIVAAALLPSVRGYNAAGPNWVAESSGQNAETFAEGSDVANLASDAQTQATLGWGLYRSSFDVSDEAMSRAVATGNPQGNVQLFYRNMMNSIAALCSKINADVYTCSGSNAIIGLETALDNANTYAGITRSSNTYFQSYVTGLTKTVLTKAQIRNDLAQIKNASGRRPNLALVNPVTFAAVASLFESQRFFMQNAEARSAVALGESDITAIDVEGCTFAEDKDGYYDSTAKIGSIYYLNTEHVRFEYIPYVDAPGFTSESVQVDIQQDNGAPVFPLNFVALAKTGSASKASVRVQLQFVVDRPNTCGIRRLIDLS